MCVSYSSDDPTFCFRPPSGFTDSREFSEAECDRERALDLEVQKVMEKSSQDEELSNMLARYVN